MYVYACIGFGLERSFYKLPVLILDDYHDISTLIVKQAYIEALYRAEEWEYERLTMRYWQNLLTEVSYSGKIDYMLERHPMHAQDVGFTRPLVPFNCDKVKLNKYQHLLLLLLLLLLLYHHHHHFCHLFVIIIYYCYSCNSYYLWQGCGAGTKRTPSKYCAIDESLLSEEYFSKYIS